MVATTTIAGAAKEMLLAPIYLYQGYKVKRDTVRLPEPEGERHGRVKLTDAIQQNIRAIGFITQLKAITTLPTWRHIHHWLASKRVNTHHEN